jgi:hypothetical protein
VTEIQAAENLLLSPQELQLNRWYIEREKLRLFPAFEFLASNGSIVAAEGALDTQYNNSYGIRVVLANYPSALPTIHPKGWSVHPDAPHKYNDGSLCVMRAAQWRTHFTVALVVTKTAIWLNKYELWKRNGHKWPGLGQAH